MRKTLDTKEGVRLPDGRVIEEGALHMGDETRVPVCWASDNTQAMPIGWAQDMEREDGLGAISFDIVMKDPEFDLRMYTAHVYATNLVEHKVDPTDTSDYPTTHVTEGRIRMIQLVPIPGIPMSMAKNIPVGK